MDRRALFLAAAALLGLAAPAAASAPPPRRSGGYSFTQLQVLTANVSRRGGRRGVFTAEVGLAVQDPAVQARVEALLPRLRSALLEVVQTYAAGMPPGAAPDADHLARLLQRQTDTVVGRAGARVLMGSMIVN